MKKPTKEKLRSTIKSLKYKIDLMYLVNKTEFIEKDLKITYKRTMTHLEQIYLCALRYGLSRRSYITGVIPDYLLVQELSDACKKVMIRDIEECKDYGHDCDKVSWMRLLKKLKDK